MLDNLLVNGSSQESSQSHASTPSSASASASSNELVALVPSIMTRTSRLAAAAAATSSNSLHHQVGISAALVHHSQSGDGGLQQQQQHPAAKPIIQCNLDPTNHTLIAKTTGFADLAFIDFSCVHFARIAQYYCELWPRRIQPASMQPLHTYKCGTCGFFFPSRASLLLHGLRKQFATARLLLPPADGLQLESQVAAKQQRPVGLSCRLFMSNSKYLEYERCLDEIIGLVEREQEAERNQVDKEVYLGWFGLVEAEKVAPMRSAHIEKLLLSARQLMMSINRQFIVDLDRWKATQQYNPIPPSLLAANDYAGFSKIHMKPHVNLTRPLLIRSKKIKRPNGNGIAASLVSAAPLTINTAKIGANYGTTSLTKKNSSSMLTAAAKQTHATTTATSNNLAKISTTNSAVAKAANATKQFKSKPDQMSMKPTPEMPIKKRRKHHHGTAIKEVEIINVAKLKASTAVAATQLTNNHSYKRIKREQLPTPPPTQIESDDDDDDVQEIDEDEEITTTTSSSTTRSSPSIFPPLPPKLTKMENVVQHLNSTGIGSGNGVIPAPPPLYKGHVPPPPNLMLSNALSNSAIAKNPSSCANSSRLASASGMMLMSKPAGFQPQPRVLANNGLPKLQQHLQPTLTPIASSGGNNAMPKLKPILPKPRQQVGSLGIQSPPPLPTLTHSPPTLISPGSIQRFQNGLVSSNSKMAPNKLLSNQLMSAAAVSGNGSGNGVAGGGGASGSPESLVRFKNSQENISLKCKFCMQVFKGQSEFFQHVIVAHAKMLKQKLNKAGVAATSNASSSIGNSTETAAKSNF